MNTKSQVKSHISGSRELRFRKYYQICYEKLQFVRWCALLFYAANQLISMSLYSITHNCFFSIAYLTNWGYLLCFLFTFVLLQTRLDERLTSRMGRVFHSLPAIQFLITSFYWAVIFPTSTHENGTELYIACVKHIFPVAHMFFEFLFNNIVFDWTSIKSFKLLIFGYLATKLVLVRLFDLQVYTMITWRGRLNRHHKPDIPDNSCIHSQHWVGPLPRPSEFQDQLRRAGVTSSSPFM
jgi:hypothetical protein